MKAILTIVQLVLGGAAVFLGMVTIMPKYVQYQGLQKQRQEMLRRIEYKKHEIMVLKDKQHRFRTDPDFVEFVARQNRRARPGELVFVFE